MEKSLLCGVDLCWVGLRAGVVLLSTQVSPWNGKPSGGGVSFVLSLLWMTV